MKRYFKRIVTRFIIISILFLIWITKVDATSISNVNIGDYFSYTPQASNYIPDHSLTGHNDSPSFVQNPIDASELTRWRIIKINTDGTVEAISENISSEYVYLRGITGYKNLSGILNTIASLYETTGITVESRCFGYDGQTEYITDDSYLVRFNSPGSSTSEYTSIEDETKGLGDLKYINDVNLVNDSLNSLVAYTLSGSENDYWTASRFLGGVSNDLWKYYGVSISGSMVSLSTNRNIIYGFIGSSYTHFLEYHHFRPIIVFNSNLELEGSGTSTDPWIIIPKVKVTFDTNGGSLISTQTITKGEKATRPLNNPTKDGYKFDDWYTNDAYETKFDFSNSTIISDTTIYAKFIKNTSNSGNNNLGNDNNNSDNEISINNNTNTTSVNDSEIVPKTGDNIIVYFIILGLSLIILIYISYYFKRKSY